MLGVKAKNELGVWIFDKLTKITKSTQSKKATEGEIINYFQSDSEKILELLSYGPSMIISPLILAGYLTILYFMYGVAFFAGLGVMVLFLLTIGIMYTFYAKFEEKYMKAKDDRIKLTSETFNALKVLKMYGWEDEFIKNVKKKRLKIFFRLKIVEIRKMPYIERF